MPDRHVAGLLQQAAACHRQGLLDQAEQLYRQVLTEGGPQMDALHLLGLVAHQRGRSQEGCLPMRAALCLNPAAAAVHANLATVLKALGLLPGAVAAGERAVRLAPHLAAAWSNLGNCRGELADFGGAAIASRTALVAEPEFAAAYLNLGNALAASGHAEEALAAYERGLRLQPSDAALMIAAGRALAEAGRHDSALGRFRRALCFAPANGDILNNLGVLLKDRTLFRRAREFYARALQVAPDDDAFASNLLYCLNYDPDLGVDDLASAYRRWNDRHALRRTGMMAGGTDRNPDRRLRIGYMSPDFRRHAARYFIQPLLTGHDRSAFELFAYAEVPRPDEVTEALHGQVDGWRSSVGLTDRQLAEQIAADGIDILIDLAGHSRGNRLAVFALKPAPLQLAWLGCACSTGVEAMDGFLADPVIAPPGSDGAFAERPVRLPSWLVFRPPADCPEPAALPALRNGYVTFGSLARSVRLNDRLVDAWTALLRAVPAARLVVDSHSFQHAEQCDWLRARFTGRGVDGNRIVPGYHSPPWKVFQQVDIALDCFPHNSGTTLLEGLHMGVPFVTLADRPPVGRLGASILTTLGRPEWIAGSAPDYVAMAAAMASDLPALAELRAGLRRQLAASPLRDEIGFARSFERALRRTWVDWCGQGRDR